MDLSEAVLTSLNAIRTADSGAGGLSGTGNANVTRIINTDDANYGADRALYDNTISVTVFESARGVLGIGASTTREKDFLLIRLSANCRRDPGRTLQNAIIYRLRSVLDGVSLATATDNTWAFGPMTVQRRRQEAATGTMLNPVLEVSCIANAGTTVDLDGRQASVSFASSEGAAIGGTLIGSGLTESITPETKDVTRWMDRVERVAVVLTRALVEVRFTKSSMTPAPPTGISAVLTVNSDAAFSKGFTYTNAIVVGYREEASALGESEPQHVILTFRVTVPTASPAGTLAIVAA